MGGKIDREGTSPEDITPKFEHTKEKIVANGDILRRK